MFILVRNNKYVAYRLQLTGSSQPWQLVAPRRRRRVGKWASQSDACQQMYSSEVKVFLESMSLWIMASCVGSLMVSWCLCVFIVHAHDVWRSKCRRGHWLFSQIVGSSSELTLPFTQGHTVKWKSLCWDSWFSNPCCFNTYLLSARVLVCALHRNAHTLRRPSAIYRSLHTHTHNMFTITEQTQWCQWQTWGSRKLVFTLSHKLWIVKIPSWHHSHLQAVDCLTEQTVSSTIPRLVHVIKNCFSKPSTSHLCFHWFSQGADEAVSSHSFIFLCKCYKFKTWSHKGYSNMLIPVLRCKFATSAFHNCYLVCCAY